MPYIQRVAKTSVRINDDGNAHRFAQGRCVLRNFRETDKPEIRHTQQAVCQTCAAQINSLETQILDNARLERMAAPGTAIRGVRAVWRAKLYQ